MWFEVDNDGKDGGGDDGVVVEGTIAVVVEVGSGGLFGRLRGDDCGDDIGLFSTDFGGVVFTEDEGASNAVESLVGAGVAALCAFAGNIDGDDECIVNLSDFDITLM
jgi:hypothetical protein